MQYTFWNSGQTKVFLKQLILLISDCQHLDLETVAHKQSPRGSALSPSYFSLLYSHGCSRKGQCHFAKGWLAKDSFSPEAAVLMACLRRQLPMCHRSPLCSRPTWGKGLLRLIAERKHFAAENTVLVIICILTAHQFH